jgi:pSer/pThr/pTyr-binding forkhead associated (FHA) protein
MSESQQERITFLLVDGQRAVSLERPVTNIGRKSDNHIVLKNPHVSRYHAQIRNIKGKFVIMDLESTVGTSVNGKIIKQTFLKEGDVISVGGIPLIFGIGTPKIPLEDPNIGPLNIDTSPTDAVNIDDADSYLDFFNTREED